MRHRPWSALSIAALILPTPAAAQRAAPREIALTIDDVPVVRPGASPLCDADSLRRWNTRFVDRIDRLGVPVAAFVVIGQVCTALRGGALREAILRWRSAGATIGNHTASHPDFHRTDLETYLRDVDRGGEYLRTVLGDNPRYFRHPYLHTGRTEATRDSLAAALKRRGGAEAARLRRGSRDGGQPGVGVCGRLRTCPRRRLRQSARRGGVPGAYR